ncbi:unnamed protein product [Boreogadus saida]
MFLSAAEVRVGGCLERVGGCLQLDSLAQHRLLPITTIFPSEVYLVHRLGLLCAPNPWMSRGRPGVKARRLSHCGRGADPERALTPLRVSGGPGARGGGRRFEGASPHRSLKEEAHRAPL